MHVALCVHVLCINYYVLVLYVVFFSSPEPKTLVRFSEHILSGGRLILFVSPSVNFSYYRSSRPNSSNFTQGRGFIISSFSYSVQRGDNHNTLKKYSSQELQCCEIAICQITGSQLYQSILLFLTFFKFTVYIE